MENPLRNQKIYKEIVFWDKKSVNFSRCARKESKKLSKTTFEILVSEN